MQVSSIRVAGVAAMFLAAVSFATVCALTCVTTHCAPPAQAASQHEHHHASNSNAPAPADPVPPKHDCGRTCPGAFVTSSKALPITLAQAGPIVVLVNLPESALAVETRITSRDHAPPLGESAHHQLSVLRI